MVETTGPRSAQHPRVSPLDATHRLGPWMLYPSTEAERRAHRRLSLRRTVLTLTVVAATLALLVLAATFRIR